MSIKWERFRPSTFRFLWENTLGQYMHTPFLSPILCLSSFEISSRQHHAPDSLLCIRHWLPRQLVTYPILSSPGKDPALWTHASPIHLCLYLFVHPALAVARRTVNQRSPSCVGTAGRINPTGPNPLDTSLGPSKANLPLASWPSRAEARIIKGFGCTAIGAGPKQK